ncbi:UxaA family hydrolase [Bacillaceae bacterium Marseille-Q3522]|nr:UxaA family hydrolase [Bacillaceae bacterium Marseille-Q3522]
MVNDVTSLVIDPKDSVAVAIAPLNEGNLALYKVNGEKRQIRIVQNIPIYHKFSLVDIKQGDQILKYGESIGVAKVDIHVGEHVHTHNVQSVREQLLHDTKEENK